jgi:hypothetical protein
MKFAIVVLQLLLAVMLAAALMPIALVSLPAAQSANVGPGLLVGALVLGFLLIRAAWPAKKR